MTLTSVELAVWCNEASDRLPVLAPEVLAARTEPHQPDVRDPGPRGGRDPGSV